MKRTRDKEPPSVSRGQRATPSANGVPQTVGVIQFIEIVKKYPILYDRRCRGTKTSLHKTHYWELVANEALLDHEYLAKQKWKHLRDNYIKHVRSYMFDHPDTKRYQQWPWAKYLGFLKPHIQDSLHSLRNTNASPEELQAELNDNSVEKDPLRIDGDSDVVYVDEPQSKYSKYEEEEVDVENLNVEEHHQWAQSNNDPSVDPIATEKENGTEQEEVIEVESTDTTTADPASTREKNAAEEMDQEACKNGIEIVRSLDPVDLLFMSYAKTMKTFPLDVQSVAKMKIAQIMGQAEIAHLQRQQRQNKKS